ncbi:MBL fold metallo-hydrolase [Hyphobacterium sp.]|uniref:MBL fold metallo-hydrolase n=1 Tax=Hyphobacterium sp. TaxID=2004662 RepID=UPI003749C577
MRSLIAAALLAATPAIASADVTIRFIANEGVHISDGETGVLIDALTWNSYDGTYALPSDEARAAMIAGDAPYDDVVALLFTHIHGDHSDPAGGAEFLNSQPDVTVAASAQVTDAIMNGETDLEDGALERIFPVELSAANPGPWQHPLFDFIEGAWVFHREGIDNITWHVEFDGISILHLGDTQPQLADFSVWDDTEFDVILYPYWFAQMEEGVAFLDSRPDARAIAFHIPATATPLTIQAGLGDREVLFGEVSSVVIETE